MADEKTTPAPLLESGLWQAGYQQGVMDTLRELAANPEGVIARATEALALQGKVYSTRAMADAIRARAAAIDPAVKAARTQALKRMVRDEAQAAEFAALIRAGNSTEEAREKMGIGAVRAKRLRAICVKMKWVRPRQRKAGAIP